MKPAGSCTVLIGVLLAAAWWTVQHALASRTRIAVLAWWVLLMTAALPTMDWASRNRKAPTIIIRKVRSTPEWSSNSASQDRSGNLDVKACCSKCLSVGMLAVSAVSLQSNTLSTQTCLALHYLSFLTMACGRNASGPKYVHCTGCEVATPFQMLRKWLSSEFAPGLK